MSKRLVGWYDRQELESVYQGLFGDDEYEKQYATNRVAVWKSRLLHRLPAAIECTVELTAALSNYTKAKNDGQLPFQDKSIRLQLSMAVIRFVNLSTENQQVAAHALPVHMVAEQIGMPSWLVELRHEAAHSNLPQLCILCKAAESALSWLKETYWKEQITSIPYKLQTDISVNEEDIIYLLDNYTSTRLMSDKTSTGIIRKQCKLFETAVKQCRTDVVRIMCNEGYLVPTPGQCNVLGILDGHPANFIPEALVDFWKPLLLAIHKYNCMPMLISEVVHQLGTVDSMRNNWLTRWFCTLIYSTSYSSDGKMGKKSLLELSCRIDSMKLIEQVLMKPSLFTEILLDSLFTCYSKVYNQEQYDHLLQLLSAMLDNSSSCTTEWRKSEPKTVAMLTVELEDSVSDSISSKKKEKKWKVDKDRDWGRLFLGCCYNGDLSYDNLAIPDASCPPILDSHRLNAKHNGTSHFDAPVDSEDMDTVLTQTENIMNCNSNTRFILDTNSVDLI